MATSLPASKPDSGIAGGRTVRRRSSTKALPSPGRTADSGDTRLSGAKPRDCRRAGAPPQGLRPSGSASPAGTAWGGSPLDWWRSLPAPASPVNTPTREGGGLHEGEEQFKSTELEKEMEMFQIQRRYPFCLSNHQNWNHLSEHKLKSQQQPLKVTLGISSFP